MLGVFTSKGKVIHAFFFAASKKILDELARDNHGRLSAFFSRRKKFETRRTWRKREKDTWSTISATISATKNLRYGIKIGGVKGVKREEKSERERGDKAEERSNNVRGGNYYAIIATIIVRI